MCVKTYIELCDCMSWRRRKVADRGKRHGAIVEAKVLENVPSDCHVACDEFKGRSLWPRHDP